MISMRPGIQRFGLAISCVSIMALGWVAQLPALTLTVDRSDDSASATGCNPAVTIDCSLRGAIIVSNLTPGVDTILIPEGTFTLDIQGDDDTAQAGDLDITDSVTIIGSGQSATVIDAGGSGGLGDRVFDIDPNNLGLTVSIQDLTVTHGYAEQGAGIYSSAILTLSRVTITANHTTISTGFRGGGLFATGIPGITATLEDCEVSENQSESEGGGIVTAVPLTLRRTLVSGNSAGTQGGGISTFHLYVTDLILEDCTISGNNAPTGGGIFLHALFAGQASIIRSSITGNTAADGAAIYGESGSVDLVNSTVSGNTVLLTGSVLYYDGGVGDFLVERSTIADNSIGSGVDIAGGSGVFSLRDSIVAGVCQLGVASSEGGNIESPGASCGLDHRTDQANVAAPELALAPLSATEGTHRLGINSVAIDRVGSGVCPAEDQRGLPRPVDGDSDGDAACDVGAVEVQLLFRDGFESSDFSHWSAQMPGPTI